MPSSLSFSSSEISVDYSLQIKQKEIQQQPLSWSIQWSLCPTHITYTRDWLVYWPMEIFNICTTEAIFVFLDADWWESIHQRQLPVYNTTTNNIITNSNIVYSDMLKDWKQSLLGSTQMHFLILKPLRLVSVCYIYQLYFLHFRCLFDLMMLLKQMIVRLIYNHMCTCSCTLKDVN